jgi:hypothetical protein
MLAIGDEQSVSFDVRPAARRGGVQAAWRERS